MPIDFLWPPAGGVVPNPTYPFLLLTGGTLTGALTLFGPPTLALHAATKAYVDAGTGAALPLTGGTLTGGLTGTTLNLSTSLTLPGGTATGFGTAIGQVPQWVNWGGSGFPGLRLSNRIIIDRSTTALGDFSDIDIRRTTSFTGGSTANINAALRITGSYGAGDATQNWPLTVVSTTSGTGGILVAADFQANRAVGSTNAVWGSISEVRDLTDLASTSGSAVLGMEIDIRANKLDNAANASTWGGFGVRKALQIVTSRMSSADATLTEFSNGIWFGQSLTSGASDTLSYMDSAIGFATNSQIIQALDTRGADPPSSFAGPVAAVRMSAGQCVDFNGGAALNSAGGNYWAYDSGSSRMKYYVAGVAVFSIDNSGNVRAAGTLTGSTTP